MSHYYWATGFPSEADGTADLDLDVACQISRQVLPPLPLATHSQT